jgi:hypothetical protein
MSVKFFPHIPSKKPIFRRSIHGGARVAIVGILMMMSLVMLVRLSHATSNFGEASDMFTIGAGARALAMGGAYTAVSDDASAPYYNPAGLAYLDEHQAMLMHAPLYLNTSYNYIASANPFGDKWGTLALSDAMLLSNKIEARDEFNNLTDGNASLQNNSIMASYARKVLRKVAVGGNVKFIQQKIVGFSGSTLGVDLGVMYKPFHFLNVGASLQNANSPSIKLRETPDVYNPIRRVGVSSEMLKGRFVLSADLIKTGKESAVTAAGVEYTPMNLFSLRAGFNDNKDYTFGMGLRLKKLRIDYAFSNADLGILNKVSLTYAWHNIYKTEIQPPMREGRAVYPLSGFENQVVFRAIVPEHTVASWSLTISNAEGKEVRTLKGDMRPNDKIVWDAKNEIGEPVVDGTYNYDFVVNYKNGKIWDVPGKIEMALPKRVNEEVIDMNMGLNGARAHELTDVDVARREAEKSMTIVEPAVKAPDVSMPPAAAEQAAPEQESAPTTEKEPEAATAEPAQ